MKNEITNLLLTIIFGGVYYYMAIPPINLQSFEFWFFVGFILLFYGMLSLAQSSAKRLLKPSKQSLIALALVPCIILGIIVIDVFNSPIIQANAYASRIEIDESADFYKDIPPVNFNHLPLLDKESSQKLGDRVMGQMPELVSQFIVSDLYTQINFNNTIMRVTPLEYDGLIKYLNNRKDGVKGFISVNSVNGEATLTKLDKGMRYMTSALLNEDLYRHVRFSYPFDVLGSANFELDNEGNPYWTIPTYRFSGVGMRKDIDALIIVNPISGEMDKYSVDDIPTWIDHVYPAQLIIEQVDNWGELRGGFLNSILGQKNVVNTTDGYNYTVVNDDVYLYSGITSKASDESNLGFILSNLRTKETHFYSVPGAEEFSAMASAQGQVQQMNYRASFPLLINLNNKATYLISLKDNAGLVKMYAFVDVTDYQKVVVSDASKGILAAAANYIGEEVKEFDQSTLKTIEESFINKLDIVVDGNTYTLYETVENIYRAKATLDQLELSLMKLNTEYNITYFDENGIRIITKIND